MYAEPERSFLWQYHTVRASPAILFKTICISSFIAIPFSQKWHVMYLAYKKLKKVKGKKKSAHEVMVVMRAKSNASSFWGKKKIIAQKLIANKY